LSFDWGEELPTLAASRVVLRPLRSDDVPALYEIFSDREALRYWSWTPFTELAAAEELFLEIQEGFRQRTLFQWGVARRSDDAVIGTCTLFRLELEHRRAELGFILARSQWGSGLMSEALNALIAFAFDPLQLHRLEADVDPRNARSLRCLKRLGFQREGLLRQRWQVGGEVQDAVFLGLLAPEWRAAVSRRA
jgi:RimJ/RimL family protein N-acetyltransferase